MLRFRRYRVFLTLAVLATFVLYQFARFYHLRSPFPIAGGGGEAGSINNDLPLESPQKPRLAEETEAFDVLIPAAESIQQLQRPPPITSIDQPRQSEPTPAVSSSLKGDVGKAPSGLQTTSAGSTSAGSTPTLELPIEQGKGTVEVTAEANSIPRVHWKPQTEHYPVPSGSTIHLPVGTPRAIPRIQYEFPKESDQDRIDREHKLAAIKEVFKYSWSGYKRNAWLQDEQMPVSGESRNPFCGWAATLVDSLDTLWIMDLKDEFEEAANAIRKIDFTTSTRDDIPLFETTIRYLGGLLAAYDVSGGKHPILLDKAVELADILMGAFDTPNRMPVTYYQWKPASASKPHRAGTRVVLAELGSLSVEFTRLAQLTKEPRYYDAVARVTDALEEWQNSTRLPGMWPLSIDASGCKRPQYASSQLGTPQVSQRESMEEILATLDKAGGEDDAKAKAKNGANVATTTPKMIPFPQPSPLIFRPDDKTKPADTSAAEVESQVNDLPEPAPDATKPIERRQLGEHAVANTSNAATEPNWSEVDFKAKEECISQGLASPSTHATETFSLGSMADSTYEYLTKEYLLLGGLVDKYRHMYEQSADVAKDKLFFRPMTPEAHNMLVSGSYSAFGENRRSRHEHEELLKPDGSHLTCFVGGMFAMGAKVFEREGDLDIAAKLTEGCVWAYNSTRTGIMPESFRVVPCASREECAWNETRWWDFLDPYAHKREEVYNAKIERFHLKAATEKVDDAKPSKPAHAVPQLEVGDGPSKVEKRRVKRKAMETDEPQVDKVPSKTTSPKELYDDSIFVGPPPPSHEEYVQARIEDERLPPGFTRIQDSRYILRPEAIESVFYMYRITGDQHWREAGWRMFTAVQAATHTNYGNSAIDDVTKKAPELLDQMESFWLAETLKYYYLLFSDESLINLDRWVLNTEAHPFKRPQ